MVSPVIMQRSGMAVHNAVGDTKIEFLVQMKKRNILKNSCGKAKFIQLLNSYIIYKHQRIQNNSLMPIYCLNNKI